MVAFVLCSLAVMFLGWFGLKLSGLSDAQARRRPIVTWYDNVSALVMFAGALCAAGGLIVLAWRFLP